MHQILWLLPPFLLTTLAFGGIIVPKLNLIKDLICRDYLAEQAYRDPAFSSYPVLFDGTPNDQCRIPAVQSRATQFMLLGGMISGILSAMTSPKLGALSDRVGRLPVTAITQIGGLTGEIITIVAASHPETFPVYWLYVGFVMDGLCGSFIAGMALSHAYATDCTPPALRSVAFGYFHGILFSGIALGPLISGFIVKYTGNLLSIFYVVLGCHSIFLLSLLLIIPESLSKHRQQAARDRLREKEESDTRMNVKWLSKLRNYNPFAPLKVLYPTGPGSSRRVRRNLVLLASVDTIMFGVGMGSMTVAILYINFQFGWDTPEQSVFLSSVNICRVLCLMLVLPLVTRLVRGPVSTRKPQRQTGCDLLDLNLIRIAVFFDTMGYLGYTLVRTGPLFILSGCVAAIGGIGSPSLQAALTKHVPHDRVGELLGANGLLHALARIVAPVIFNSIYSATVGKFTQAVFLCLTCGFAIAFVVSWFIRPGVYLDDPSSVPPSRAGLDPEDEDMEDELAI